MDNDRDILLIAMLTFITVVLWVFFELVKTTRVSTVTTSTTQLLAPISSKIDTNTLDTLRQRTNYK